MMPNRRPEGEPLEPAPPQQADRERIFRSRRAALEQAYALSQNGKTASEGIRGCSNFKNIAIPWGDAIVIEKPQTRDRWTATKEHVQTEWEKVMSLEPIRETAKQYPLQGDLTHEIALPGKYSKATSLVRGDTMTYIAYAQEQINLSKWDDLRALVEILAQFLMEQDIIKETDDSFDKEAEAELLEQLPARPAMMRPMIIPPLEAPSEDDEEDEEES